MNMSSKLRGCAMIAPLMAAIALGGTPCVSASDKPAPDNTLTDAERRGGWLLLFDGRSHAGWMNSDRTAPRTPVEDGALNPHRAGHYMLVHTQLWTNFVLSLDF